MAWAVDFEGKFLHHLHEAEECIQAASKWGLGTPEQNAQLQWAHIHSTLALAIATKERWQYTSSLADALASAK